MQYDLSKLKKCDFKENIFIMLQCRTTIAKFLRILELIGVTNRY